MCLLMKQIIFILNGLCTIWLTIVIIIEIHQEVYGSSSDEVPANYDDLSIDSSKSFRYKVALVQKTANAVNNANSSVKKT